MLENRSVRELADHLAEHGAVSIMSPAATIAIPNDERELLQQAARLVDMDVEIRRVGDEVVATKMLP